MATWTLGLWDWPVPEVFELQAPATRKAQQAGPFLERESQHVQEEGLAIRVVHTRRWKLLPTGVPAAFCLASSRIGLGTEGH